MCAYFMCSQDLLEDWCQKTYFVELDKKILQGQAIARIRLKQDQRNMALRNASMAIWLGRQYLGQLPVPSEENENDLKNDGLWDAISQAVNKKYTLREE